VRPPLRCFLLQRGEVELGDRLVDEPALILAVEDLARDPGGRFEREVRDLGTDEVERALRLRVDLPLRLLEPALSLLLRFLLDPRMSAASLLALAMSARCCSRSCWASARAWSASSTALRIRSRRSSIARWIGPKAHFLRTKNVIVKQTSVQIMRPGTTWIRPSLPPFSSWAKKNIPR
jgi:hypothetical protein